MHSLQKSQGQGFAFQFSQESFQKELLNQNPPKRPTMAQGLGEKKHNNTTHPAGKGNLPKQITNTNFSQFLGKSPRKFNQKHIPQKTLTRTKPTIPQEGKSTKERQ
jgi:hypothetical protein